MSKLRFSSLILIFSFMASPIMPEAIRLIDTATAQEEKKKKPKTRRSQVLSKAAFNQITSAQEALSEGNHETAMNILLNMMKSDRYNSYEKGVAQQTYAYVWADKGDYSRALVEFERALNLGVLPEQVQLDLTYNLAQLSIAEDKPKQALRYLNRWFSQVEEPSASAYGLKAQIYLIMDNLKQAEKNVTKAISMSESPKEAWYRILLSVYLQQERYKESLPILELVVDRFPGKKAFWQQLSAVYQELGKEQKAFAAQQAMHSQDMLTTSKELVRIAQLYLYNDFPYKAARILDKGLKDGSIKKTSKNWELLATAWMHSREWKKSRSPLLKAASKSKSGKLYAQLGQAYIQDEDWKNAEKYLIKAVDKGKLEKRESNTYLVLGITQARLGKYEKAIKTFRKAGDFDDTAKDAFKWIRSLERQLAEKAREEKEKQKAG
ncbi:Sec-independent protein translocase protein TatB [Candidatus Micropelagos thuwalensis]|uniref:Sec-independent protein translocase protein TatB n=1 Tax=Candidatus Micropelagius thuwalensis TaxID=1397666 RepID=U2WV93_9PROT|nr:tetratricopeptide repeat protein [Candidatus Micropelagos thuwalensis]ERL47443.1 Sec-independent protein translocase protein TatB [Candidatus Micropelagos thuwalensis]